MKNLQLLFIIALAIGVGYFAFPYFNPRTADHVDELNSAAITYADGRKDFSYYIIRNSREMISVSPVDPRLQYIKGKYRGQFDGAIIEMDIADSMSGINFFTDSSFTAPNAEIFYNVNDNGNTLLILTGERKFFVNFRNWPEVVLNEGYSNQVVLRKIQTEL